MRNARRHVHEVYRKIIVNTINIRSIYHLFGYDTRPWTAQVTDWRPVDEDRRSRAWWFR